MISNWTQQKERKAKKMLDALVKRAESRELSDREHAIFEVLMWAIHDEDQPDLDQAK